MANLVEVTDRGLYCAPGDFFVDPWRPVARAVVTHAHSDHAHAGCERYLTASEGAELLRTRLGDEATIETLDYGQPILQHSVRVSLHPAGHILGSAQVRLEHAGQVWVVSGDFKTEADPTCEPFAPIACHTLITESTFALPIYRWPSADRVFAEIHQWWRGNQARGRTSLLFGWSLGKAQRLLAGLDPSIGPILTHGSVERYAAAYRRSGVSIAPTIHATEETIRMHRGAALAIAPPTAIHSPWARRFGEASTAIASGWMQVRGARRRRSVDRGFIFSDHADWNGLLSAIAATGAERVMVTHGYAAVLTRWLNEHGVTAQEIATQYEGETAELAAKGRPAAEPAEPGIEVA